MDLPNPNPSFINRSLWYFFRSQTIVCFLLMVGTICSPFGYLASGFAAISCCYFIPSLPYIAAVFNPILVQSYNNIFFRLGYMPILMICGIRYPCLIYMFSFGLMSGIGLLKLYSDECIEGRKFIDRVVLDTIHPCLLIFHREQDSGCGWAFAGVIVVGFLAYYLPPLMEPGAALPRVPSNMNVPIPQISYPLIPFSWCLTEILVILFFMPLVIIWSIIVYIMILKELVPVPSTTVMVLLVFSPIVLISNLLHHKSVTSTIGLHSPLYLRGLKILFAATLGHEVPIFLHFCCYSACLGMVNSNAHGDKEHALMTEEKEEFFIDAIQPFIYIFHSSKMEAGRITWPWTEDSKATWTLASVTIFSSLFQLSVLKYENRRRNCRNF